jgi:hypothetical protein
MDPQSSRTTVLDGGWWPRSTNAVDELPALITALGGSRGVITHVLLSSADWDLPHPRRVGEGRGAVRLGWYTSQPSGLISVMSEFGRDRFDLLVVPPDASRASADTALTAAADGADKRRAPELLTGIEHTG